MKRPTSRSALLRISWGLLLVLLDLRLSGVDVLPDAIGYGLMGAGLYALRAAARGYGAAAWTARIYKWGCTIVAAAQLIGQSFALRVDETELSFLLPLLIVQALLTALIFLLLRRSARMLRPFEMSA
ncbi:hypothetical protein IDH44_01680 [Paenibacillus sp. IB182496]|uniref:Uncharacterized protein n=1 Tax=Paenibacillus sabuli TaxID=2772509 RepID=A0A927BQW6_9BACL|nr:hypothetical protein [Paenibacillus sabuli]MBD2843889.1 hypothetical protein [Paenibacillus sabuli]